MVLFGDISKPCDDLFRGFPHDKPWSVGIRNRLTNPNFNHTACLTPSGSISHSAGTTFTVPGPIKLTTSLNADGAAILAATYPTPFCTKLVLGGKVTGSLWKGSSPTTEISADVTGYGDHSKTVLDINSLAWSHSHCFSPNSEAMLGENTDVKVGFEVTGRDTRESLNCHFGAAISKSTGDARWMAAVKANPVDDPSRARVSLLLHSRATKPSTAEFGVEVSQLIAQKQSKVTIGAMWRPNANDMETYLKAKVDHEGKILACVGHRLNDQVGVVVGCMFDGTKLASSKEPNVKCGLQLNLLA